MQINKHFFSIKWRFVVTYVAVIVTAFLMLSFIGTKLFTDTIVNQRIYEKQKKLNNLSVSVAPYLLEYDVSHISNLLIGDSRDDGGRYFVLNKNGVILFDSFSMLTGKRLYRPEVYDVLFTNMDFSYGFEKVKIDNGSNIWCANYSTAIVSEYEKIGILLYSQSVQDIIDKSTNITKTLIIITIITSIIIIFISLFLSDYITKPIIKLRDYAIEISKGKLHQRISIAGNNEMSSLGETFNIMSERLENMDNAKTEFVSNASHELKTPISSMKILVQSLLIQDNVSNEIYKDFLGDIDIEMDRLNAIISDLLMLAKIEDKQSALNYAKIHFANLTKDVIDSIKPIADSKNITIEYDILDRSTILADKVKLRICIENIVSNAVKYTDEFGKVVIKVFSDRDYIKLEINDTGVGIRPEDIKKIFERFYRVDKARDRRTGGTGLGLHIAKRIAHLHGGDIYAKSIYGRGSTFTMVLPKNKRGIKT